MNNKEHKELLEAFRKYTKKLLSSKKASKDFLVRSGIYDNKGELSQNYIPAK